MLISLLNTSSRYLSAQRTTSSMLGSFCVDADFPWRPIHRTYGSLPVQDNNFYLPYSEGGISIKEDSLDIDWKILTENALLSERDTMYREEL